MNLTWVRIHGYKRFRDSSTIQLSARLVAIVGPNEAGKSTLLEALRHLNSDDQLQPNELTRRVTIPQDRVVFEAALLLEEEDRSLLSDIHEGERIRWFKVSKRTTGPREYAVEPRPRRDLKPRVRTVKKLKQLSRSPHAARVVEGSERVSLDLVNELLSLLDREEETLDPATIEKIEELAQAIENEFPASSPAYIKELPNQLSGLGEDESLSHPSELAVRKLSSALPMVVEFNAEERLLQSAYELNQVAPDPPAALRNLAKVSGLNLMELQTAAASDNQADVETLKANANSRLKEVFSELWSQSSIVVRFHVNGTALHIQIEDQEHCYSSLADRSEGLRQFVALLAFCAVKEVESPILLIDEAETHLHYDGQADLIQMFSRQTLSPKIVYTTHSAGCLPEDLGMGVRLTSPVGNTPYSEIRNWFWAENQPGFSPLLFGMGAKTLAFFPVRYAVIGEGPTDLILLPSLLREVTGKFSIGFQVVPGLSVASKGEMSLLEQEAPRVLYLVDGDKGGERLAAALEDAGVPPERILRLAPKNRQNRQPCVLEDFISREIYCDSVNEYIANYCPDVTARLRRSDIPSFNRPAALDCWFAERNLKPPGKRIIAHNVLDYSFQRPDVRLVENNRAKRLLKLYDEISSKLGLRDRD